MSASDSKFEKLIFRLKAKINMSATPVTGFIVGLSGTDSILTYMMLQEIVRDTGQYKVKGIHYVHSPIPTPFIREVKDWLEEQYPFGPRIEVASADTDAERWADLHDRALVDRDWVVSTVNATEQALGTYSILANSASIKPIVSLYKSEVLELCKQYKVPAGAIARSQLPDCICGRSEFAAENITLIDEVLRYNLSQNYDGALLRNAMDYIRETRRDNDFKSRTPYGV